MRSLSVALGAISTVGVFLLVRESEGWEANLACRERAAQSGLLAALGLALSPFQIEYSQEIRMYALGGALTIWTSWSLVYALKKE